MDYSLVLPAYNEVTRIGKTLLEYWKNWQTILSPRGKKYEIIVVANGCRDGTALLVRLLREGPLVEAPIRLFTLPEANKGLAILEGFLAARGRVVGFADADGAFSPATVLSLMELAEKGKVAIASKYVSGRRRSPLPLMRKIASWIWNFLVRMLFGLRVTDTQAGAKAMPAECAQAILSRVYPCGFAFDVSLLWEAHKAGYEITEVPVRWEHLAGSKFGLVREAPRMFVALVRLRLGLFRPARAGRAQELPLVGKTLPLSELLGASG